MYNKPRNAEPKQSQCWPFMVAEATHLSTPRQGALGVAFEHAEEVAGVGDEVTFLGCGMHSRKFPPKKRYRLMQVLLFRVSMLQLPKVDIVIFVRFRYGFSKKLFGQIFRAKFVG